MASRIKIPLAFLIALLVSLLYFYKLQILGLPILVCIGVYFFLFFVDIRSFKDLASLNSPAIKVKVKWKFGFPFINFAHNSIISISTMLILYIYLGSWFEGNELFGWVLPIGVIFFTYAFERMDDQKNYIYVGYQGFLIPNQHNRLVDWNDIEKIEDSYLKDQIKVTENSGKTLLIRTSNKRNESLDYDDFNTALLLSFIKENLKFNNMTN